MGSEWGDGRHTTRRSGFRGSRLRPLLPLLVCVGMMYFVASSILPTIANMNRLNHRSQENGSHDSGGCEHLFRGRCTAVPMKAMRHVIVQLSCSGRFLPHTWFDLFLTRPTPHKPTQGPFSNLCSRKILYRVHCAGNPFSLVPTDSLTLGFVNNCGCRGGKHLPRWPMKGLQIQEYKQTPGA